jgi:hypothetical protein
MWFVMRRPRAFWISICNIIGLLFSLTGVVLLFWYALPNAGTQRSFYLPDALYAVGNNRFEGEENAYLATKNPWLQRQLHSPLALGDLPFVVGRAPVAGEELPPLQPDLKLDDTPPFRLSRNHLMIEKRDRSYHVRDLRSTLGTIVNGEPIGIGTCDKQEVG